MRWLHPHRDSPGRGDLPRDGPLAVVGLGLRTRRERIRGGDRLSPNLLQRTDRCETRPDRDGSGSARLERGRSAREALEVIAGLIEVHGQGGPSFAPDAEGYHNAFLLADPNEAWLLETSNRRWAARRCAARGCFEPLLDRLGLGVRFARPRGVCADGGLVAQSGRLDVNAAYCDRDSRRLR